MSEKNITVYLYIDKEEKPIAELVPPVTFKLDTTKLTDGEHLLKIVSKFDQKEGLKIIQLTVFQFNELNKKCDFALIETN